MTLRCHYFCATLFLQAASICSASTQATTPLLPHATAPLLPHTADTSAGSTAPVSTGDVPDAGASGDLVGASALVEPGMNVQVVIRCRPMNSKEDDEQAKQAVQITDNTIYVTEFDGRRASGPVSRGVMCCPHTRCIVFKYIDPVSLAPPFQAADVYVRPQLRQVSHAPCLWGGWCLPMCCMDWMY